MLNALETKVPPKVMAARKKSHFSQQQTWLPPSPSNCICAFCISKQSGWRLGDKHASLAAGVGVVPVTAETGRDTCTDTWLPESVRMHMYNRTHTQILHRPSQRTSQCVLYAPWRSASLGRRILFLQNSMSSLFSPGLHNANLVWGDLCAFSHQPSESSIHRRRKHRVVLNGSYPSYADPRQPDQQWI